MINFKYFMENKEQDKLQYILNDYWRSVNAYWTHRIRFTKFFEALVFYYRYKNSKDFYFVAADQIRHEDVINLTLKANWQGVPIGTDCRVTYNIDFKRVEVQTTENIYDSGRLIPDRNENDENYDEKEFQVIYNYLKDNFTTKEGSYLHKLNQSLVDFLDAYPYQNSITIKPAVEDILKMKPENSFESLPNEVQQLIDNIQHVIKSDININKTYRKWVEKKLKLVGVSFLLKPNRTMAGDQLSLENFLKDQLALHDSIGDL